MENGMQTLLDKKMTTSWQGKKMEQDVENNFKLESELTVTITLNEYRVLVREVAKKEHDLEKANSEMTNLRRQRDDAVKKLEAFRELYASKTANNEDNDEVDDKGETE